jgi:propanol-preferring alcohol dehydrogenase
MPRFSSRRWARSFPRRSPPFARPAGWCARESMSDKPAFPYRLLWGERQVSSVANLTRRDGEEFMALTRRLELASRVERFALRDANLALERLRSGAVTGAAVLEMAAPAT